MIYIPITMTNSLFDTPFYKGNVVFNFLKNPIGDLAAFASGYHKAGQLLVKRFEKIRGYADYEGYPVFFLYRHSMELYLKAIAYRGAKLLELMTDDSIAKDPELLSSHGLTRYLSLLKRICKEGKWDMDKKGQGEISVNDAMHAIEEMEMMDSHSYTFRYPVIKSGSGTLGHHTVLNVIHFGRTLDPVLNLLDAMASAIDCEWDNAAEILYEIQEILRSE